METGGVFPRPFSRLPYYIQKFPSVISVFGLRSNSAHYPQHRRLPPSRGSIPARPKILQTANPIPAAPTHPATPALVPAPAATGQVEAPGRQPSGRQAPGSSVLPASQVPAPPAHPPSPSLPLPGRGRQAAPSLPSKHGRRADDRRGGDRTSDRRTPDPCLCATAPGRQRHERRTVVRWTGLRRAPGSPCLNESARYCSDR